VRLAKDPDGLARDLARPMPRPPAPAATRGTRFHAWVEAQFGAQPLLDRLDLEGAADDDLVPDDELGALQEAFLAGPYGAVPPPLRLGPTAVRNVTGWHLFDLGPGREPAEIIPGHRHAC